MEYTERIPGSTKGKEFKEKAENIIGDAKEILSRRNLDEEK